MTAEVSNTDAPETPELMPDIGSMRTGTGRRLRSPLLLVGLGIVGIVVLAAVFAPELTSFDPHAITGHALETPSARHRLGTDIPGRDLYAQLLYGTRASLLAAVVGGGVAMAGAILLGVLPALFGGLADTVANRVAVFLLALPGLPLLILIGALAGNNQLVLLLMIGFGGVAPNTRILRSQAVALRSRGFIAAARGLGAGPFYLVRRHLVPAMGPLVLIGFVNWAATAVGIQAALSFLGLGDPSGVSWGLMMNRALAQQGIYFSPMWTWWVLPPGIAITVTLLGLTFVGIALEPSFNPRWHRSS